MGGQVDVSAAQLPGKALAVGRSRYVRSRSDRLLSYVAEQTRLTCSSVVDYDIDVPYSCVTCHTGLALTTIPKSIRIVIPTVTALCVDTRT